MAEVLASLGDVLGATIGVLLVAALVVWRVRRWWRLTPEQRRIERLEYKAREIEREQRRRAWD